MLPELTREEFALVLRDVAADLLCGAGVAAPPVDAIAVAARLGLIVAEDARQSGRARYVRLGRAGGQVGQPAILVRPEPRPERRQWAVAHEIGEHMAWRVFAALGVDPTEAPALARERVANSLAGQILVPQAWFTAAGSQCGWDLARLKERFGTASHELLARRMLDAPPPIIVTVFDQGRIGFRRSNLLARVPPLAAEEQACWADAHRGRASHRAGRLRVAGWPVHEPGWQREILRTELPECMPDD